MLPFGAPPAPVKNLVAGTNVTLSPTNGKGSVTINAANGASSPLTTKGDIWGFSTVDARLPVGTNGFPLLADSGQTLGVGWATRDFNFNAKNLVNINSHVMGATATAHGAVFSDQTAVTISSNISSGGAGIFQWDMTPASWTVSAGQGVSNSALVSLSPTWTLSGDTYIMSGIVMTPTFSGTVPPSQSARWVDVTPQCNTTGTWPEVVSFWGDPTIGSGVTVTNYRGLVVGNINNGTVTTSTGVDIGVTTTLNGSTTWGLVCGNYNSYFQGNTSFGTTAAPTYPVDAVGTIRSANTSTSVATFIAAPTGTPAASTVLAGYSDTTAMPIGTNASAVYASFYAAPTITGTSSAQYLGFRCNASSTGAYTGSPIAGDFTFTQSGSGTIGSGRAVSFSYISHSGTTTTAYGLDAGLATTGGTITKALGVAISTLNLGGTISTTVGLDIGVTQGLAGSAIWAVQSGNYNSFWNGLTTFGSNTTPAYAVHIRGGGNATTNSATNALGLDTSTTGPADPGSNAGLALQLFKGTTNYYILIRFNDGGTTRYKYLQLNGTGTTWATGTSLPA